MQSLILTQGRLSVRLPLSTFNQSLEMTPDRVLIMNMKLLLSVYEWKFQKRKLEEFERGESTWMHGFNTCDQSHSSELQKPDKYHTKYQV